MRNPISDNEVSVRVLSDPNMLDAVGEAWNRIVREYGSNPFMLSGVLSEFIRSGRREGWRPLLLLLSVDGTLIGIVPLMTRKRFGLQFTRLLLAPWLSPDFALDEQYRKKCIEEIVAFVFRDQQTKLMELTLPSNSPNLEALKAECLAKKLRYDTRNDSRLGHRIVPVTLSWDDFVSRLGHDFRRNTKRMRRNLTEAGTWKIEFVDLGKEPQEIERINNVERSSWKQERMQSRGELDRDLHAIITGAAQSAKSEPDFGIRACFLELNNLTIAYELVLQYRRSAYFTKTSFVEEYRKLSPGVFVIHEAIHSLCDNREVKEIDFLTNLPVWNNWPGITATRTTITITPSRLYRVVDWIMRAGACGYLTLLRLLAYAKQSP